MHITLQALPRSCSSGLPGPSEWFSKMQNHHSSHSRLLTASSLDWYTEKKHRRHVKIRTPSLFFFICLSLELTGSQGQAHHITPLQPSRATPTATSWCRQITVSTGLQQVQPGCRQRVLFQEQRGRTQPTAPNPQLGAGRLPARWGGRGAAGRRPGWERHPEPPPRSPARPRSASRGSPRGGTAPAGHSDRIAGPFPTPTPLRPRPRDTAQRGAAIAARPGARPRVAPQVRPPPSGSAEGGGRGNGRAAAATHFVQHLEDNEGERGE